MIILIIVLCIIGWIFCGQIAFLLEANIEKQTTYGENEIGEHALATVLGPLGLIIMIFYKIITIFKNSIKFKNIMEFLMRKVNKK